MLRDWKLDLHFDGEVCKFGRRPGRPRTRWEDELNMFLGSCGLSDTQWLDYASQSQHWSELADSFSEGDWKKECLTHSMV